MKSLKKRKEEFIKVIAKRKFLKVKNPRKVRATVKAKYPICQIANLFIFWNTIKTTLKGEATNLMAAAHT